jgi:hypothetical protein
MFEQMNEIWMSGSLTHLNKNILETSKIHSFKQWGEDTWGKGSSSIIHKTQLAKTLRKLSRTKVTLEINSVI